jgi:hypothetical protein
MNTSEAATQGLVTCIQAHDAPEAISLGRSLRLNSPATRAVCIVDGELPPGARERLLECYEHVYPLRPEHQGLGWQVKQTMVQYTPFDKSLFLDSDCLVLKDLTPFLEQADPQPICFATKAEPLQETGAALYAVINLQYLFKRFNVDWWPQILGGGHFVFLKTPEAHRIFERALYWRDPELIREFGWTESKRTAPDELTLQIALVEAGLNRSCAMPDAPLMYWTPWESGWPDVFEQRTSHIDSATGRRVWDDGHYVAHFGGVGEHFVFLREQWRLSWFGGAGAGRAHRAAAWITKPIFHIAALLWVKGRNGWGRVKRAFGADR